MTEQMLRMIEKAKVNHGNVFPLAKQDRFSEDNFTSEITESGRPMLHFWYNDKTGSTGIISEFLDNE